MNVREPNTPVCRQLLFALLNIVAQILLSEFSVGCMAIMVDVPQSKRGRCCVAVLMFVGVVACLTGLFIGKLVIPRIIIERAKENVCIDSASHSQYKSWVSNLIV